MKCPFCQSDKLESYEDGSLTSETTLTSHCCEDCGGSFYIIQEPQDILLADVKSREE